jgi:DNA-binding LacI/PurR family transcriptional regulator
MSSNHNKKTPVKVNIRYLAEVAGVAPSTISRALSNDSRTSPKTIKKIQKLAKELNYYPNSLAKGLREKKTNTIGVILTKPLLCSKMPTP